MSPRVVYSIYSQGEGEGGGGGEGIMGKARRKGGKQKRKEGRTRREGSSVG
jgi:hypothetical protein